MREARSTPVECESGMTLPHLLAEIVGARNVFTDPAQTKPYFTDWRRQYFAPAECVVRPGATTEVAAAVALGAREDIGVVAQGGNTGLVGGSVPTGTRREIVLSLGRMNRIRSLDPLNDTITVEAGCVLAAVQKAAEGAGRLFPLSLAAEGSCQIGGNLSTNAGGVNVLRYGTAREQVLGLEVVLADGRVWNGLRTLRKDNTGYDLKQLFLGAEGTLGVIPPEALRPLPRPRARAPFFAGVASPEAALELLGRARGRFGELVTSFELINAFCVDIACEHLPGVRFVLTERSPWYVLAELAWSLPEGLEAAADNFLAEAFEAGLVQDVTRAQSGAQRDMLWSMRDGISEATRTVGAVIRHDVSVPVARVPELIARATALLEKEYPQARAIPFGHVGDGNLHLNALFPLDDPGVPAARKRLPTLVFDLVQDMGGSISAEHGIGRLKRAELHARKDPLDIELMRRLKATLDPEGILNPG